MLVLSRSENEKVVFPQLGVTVEVLRVQGKRVRVGVEAPPEIRVLRDELVSDENYENGSPNPAAARRHEVRNRLHTALLGLHLLQKQASRGMTKELDATLNKVLSQLESLETELNSIRGPIVSLPRKTTATRRALLVEDDDNERELLAGFLKLSGYEVSSVADGQAALDHLAREPRPDVVLLDMHMPRLGGPATITRIRCNPAFAGLKLIAVSGSERAEAGVAIGPRGVDRWLSKPLNPQRLLDEINREFEAETRVTI